MTDIKTELNLNLNNIHGYYGLEENDLFDIATRKNPKRNFLFVSKLIGKHIPIDYGKLEYTGNLLANRFFNETYNMELYTENQCNKMSLFIKNKCEYEEFIPLEKENEKILIIGFAETATGLGFSFFKNFSNAYYVHTTRQKFNEKSLFCFSEDHSHAKNHECYFRDTSILKDIDRIILIDDEFTTGKTCLNLITALNKKYQIKKYSLISILDWRNKISKENFKKYSIENNISIDVISLLSGEIEYETKDLKINDKTDCQTYCDKNYYNFYLMENSLNFNGNIELSSSVFKKIDTLADLITDKLQELNIESPLVMGLEENIYLPSVVSKKLKTKFASMTLSPIYPKYNKNTLYPIKNAFCFTNSNKTFLYNIDSKLFSNIVIICDKKITTEAKENLTGYLHKNGYKKICFCNIGKE